MRINIGFLATQAAERARIKSMRLPDAAGEVLEAFRKKHGFAFTESQALIYRRRIIMECNRRRWAKSSKKKIVSPQGEFQF